MLKACVPFYHRFLPQAAIILHLLHQLCQVRPDPTALYCGQWIPSLPLVKPRISYLVARKHLLLTWQTKDYFHGPLKPACLPPSTSSDSPTATRSRCVVLVSSRFSYGGRSVACRASAHHSHCILALKSLTCFSHVLLDHILTCTNIYQCSHLQDKIFIIIWPASSIFLALNYRYSWINNWTMNESSIQIK